jgi:diadenosine tetraphosphate (Ap4A) HIT family hydrolase
MAEMAATVTQECIFCAIVARQAQAFMVHEDEVVVVFMDLHPVTPGHLLVVPRVHAAGLEDLDKAVRESTFSSATAKSPCRRSSISTFT